MKGFRDFILRGNVVDLAVGVVVGAAFNTVVQSLVKDILTPFIAAIVHQPDFSKLSFTIHDSVFQYGEFLNSLISFLIVAAAVYFFVVLPIDKMVKRFKKPPEPEPEKKPADVALLEEIRDLLKEKRGA
jgi:large conductance mechanosensitive channel